MTLNLALEDRDIQPATPDASVSYQTQEPLSPLVQTTLICMENDLTRANRLFVTEPVGDPKDQMGEQSLIVSEAAQGKESPLDTVTQLLESARQGFEKLGNALGDHPQKELLLRDMHWKIMDLSVRVDIARQITWHQERLSVFSYGGVWRPELDELR